jgi:DUF4097 and DUF4098 domain-containing protein YvlB
MMFWNKRITVLSAVFALIAVVAPAEDETADRVTVELTDPSQPAFLSVGLINGGITVTGYDGKEVIVEAKTDLKKIDRSGEGSGKSAGMVRIPVNSSSLTVEEYRNKVEIGTDSWANRVDLTISVPKKTSLELSCVNSGDITVENVEGDIDASNTNGSVSLLNIAGSAVANAHNGDVTVTLVRIDPEKDMAFSSFNGDVDVAFPASIKAKVKLKTVQGEIYSDFEIKQIENPERVIRENHRDSGGKYMVKIDRAFWGTINGGGQEIQFSNYNGDIYIRKQK